MFQYFSHGKATVEKTSSWKFAYIGGTGTGKSAQDSLTLTALPIGDRARVSGYEGKEEIDDFRRSGLSIGVEIQVLSRKPSGSVVIQLADGRIGLGARVVDRILVQPV
jgi:hypothetical protein